MNKVLVIVDVQNDFCEGGYLPVQGGNEVARRIMEYVAHSQRPGRRVYDRVLTTQDWHIDPGSHWSSDPDYIDSWPVHCQAGTWGAQLHPAVEALGSYINERYYKGMFSAAYSGTESLVPLDIPLGSQIDVCGLALDYCVFETAKALNIKNSPYHLADNTVRILQDLSMPINADNVKQQQASNAGISWVLS